MAKQIAKRRPIASTASMVLAVLQQDQRPYSAYELMDRLRDQGVAAPATVYRALERLIAAGSVHRLETLNAYIACRRGHHQGNFDVVFAICDDCGNVEEFSSSSVEAATVKWTKANSFALNAVTFELRGICGTCRISADSDVARA